MYIFILPVIQVLPKIFQLHDPIKKGWVLPAMKEKSYDIGEVPDIEQWEKTKFPDP